jgi:CDP-glucose 4,6-dehydratase
MVTGHTGFKGGWLSLWLHRLGAVVHGCSLEPPTTPSLFEAANIGSVLKSDIRADLRDLLLVRSAFAAVQPEIVFHLAAQPLVRESYHDPIGTLATNVMGTAHVLEVARSCGAVRAIVVITTDKVYENHETPDPYRESDPLGGHDPYSASKAAAEIVTASFRSSFFSAAPNSHPAIVATTRAGNVIGGGDWAADRLVPYCLRALIAGESVRLRYPSAVRPWQHVLEPLAGYLQLAEHLLGADGRRFARAWNFGPDVTGDATVGEVAGMTARMWGRQARVEEVSSPANPHEAGLLRLDSTRAREELSWAPKWSLEEALQRTVCWHRALIDRKVMAAVSLNQIDDYESVERT